MTIPETAIEAAARELWERGSSANPRPWMDASAGLRDRYRMFATAALSAAAPFIAAQALRDAAEAHFSMSPDDWTQFHRENPNGGVGGTVAETWLRARAATIETESSNV